MYRSMCESIALRTRGVPCRRSCARRGEGPWGRHPRAASFWPCSFDYLDVAASFLDVEAAILDDPRAWVPGLLRAAEDRGQHLLAEVGFAVDTRRIDKGVEIELGAPIRIPSKTALPMTWRATRPEGLFPQLDADVEVASLGANRTQLSVSARYRTPMGAGVGCSTERCCIGWPRRPSRTSSTRRRKVAHRKAREIRAVAVPACSKASLAATTSAFGLAPSGQVGYRGLARRRSAHPVLVRRTTHDE